MSSPPPAGESEPWSEETEISVLGGMLIDEEARAEALERLEAEDFHRESNARIFDAFRRLNGRGREADVTTLADELRSADEMEAVGGMPYLARLVEAVPTGANVQQHAARLRELRALRELEDVATDALEIAGRAGPGEAGDVLSALTERVRDIEDRAVGPGERRVRTAREILDDPDARRTPVTVAEKLAWEGHVTMLAGREKSGKSTLLRWTVARRTAGGRVWGGPAVEGPVTVLYYGQESPVDVAADLERMGADLDRVHVADMRQFRNRMICLERDVEDLEPDLVVVDTLSTLTALLELDPGNASDWEPQIERLGALADRTGAAVAVSHHARKADGEYRDSTAIGAGVDCILEMRRDPHEGRNVRAVTAKPRSAVDATDFSFELVEDGSGPRLELLDGSLSLEERVQRFVRRHEGCGQREVIEGVRGKGADVRDALKSLCEDGGPLVEDASTTPYEYRTRQDPRGNGPETVGKRSGNGDTGNGGRSVSPSGERPEGSPREETQAEPVGEEP